MAGTLRFGRRPGVSRVLALVVVAVLGVSAIGAVAVLSLSQTPSSSGSTSSSSTEAASPSTASTTATSTSSPSSAPPITTSTSSASTTSLPCLFNSTASMAQLNATVTALVGNLTGLYNEGPGNATVAELFGNFSQMTVTSNIVGTMGLATSSSYQVIGRPTIGSLEYYEVNFTTSTTGFNVSTVDMFAPNGTVTSVSSPVLGDFTGASAESMGQADVSSYLILLHAGVYASGVLSDPNVAVLNSTTVALGPTQVKMTYYTLKSLPMTYCGTTLSNLVEGIGTVQGTGLTMILYEQAQISEQGITMGETTSVTSLTVTGH